jgi:hypothetical protein
MERLPVPAMVPFFRKLAQPMIPVLLLTLLRFRFALDCRKGWLGGRPLGKNRRPHALRRWPFHPWTADPGRWDHVDGALTILAAQRAPAFPGPPPQHTQKSPSKA